MHILIIGASGRTGKLILAEALQRSHTVTAIVRTPASITAHPSITIIQGSPTNAADVEKAFQASPTPPDAVIVALNSQRASDNPFAAQLSPPDLMFLSTKNVVSSMRKFGVRKLINLSSFGVGESIKNAWLPVRFMMSHTNMKVGMRDHEMVEEFMRGEGKEGIEWVGVKPVRLSDGGRAAVKVFGEMGEGVAGMATCSRESVAGWLVDCAEDQGEWVGRTPVISN